EDGHGADRRPGSNRDHGEGAQGQARRDPEHHAADEVTASPETRLGVRVGRLQASVHEIPVDGPDGCESDGTLEWSSTTMVVVEAEADGTTGTGYTYADASAGALIDSKLAAVAEGSDPFALKETWSRMSAELRNTGRPGL